MRDAINFPGSKEDLLNMKRFTLVAFLFLLSFVPLGDTKNDLVSIAFCYESAN